MKPVADVIFAPDESVNAPLFVIVMPLLVDAAVLLKVNAVPVRLIVPALKAPVNVVIPVPALCVRELAVKLDEAVAFLQLVIVTAPSCGVEPTADEKKISPPPAVRFRLCVPLSCPVNVMLPPDELRAEEPPSETVPAKEIAALEVVILLERVIVLPVPV